MIDVLYILDLVGTFAFIGVSKATEFGLGVFGIVFITTLIGYYVIQFRSSSYVFIRIYRDDYRFVFRYFSRTDDQYLLG